METQANAELELEAPAPDYSEDGVDLSLLRAMLALTPAERLQALEDHMNFAQKVRDLNGGL